MVRVQIEPYRLASSLMTRRSPIYLASLAFTLFVTALLGCRDAKLPTDGAGGRAQRSIVDGNDEGGNPHFFFLPPIGKATKAGPSDASATPSVTVCEWRLIPGSERVGCAAIVAQFSAQTGTGGARIRYDAADEAYAVNWKTSECMTGPCSLDPAKQYRLSIGVGVVELGFADVRAVANGSQMKNAQNGEDIVLVDGRTLPIRFRIEQGAVPVGSGVVGPTGGGLSSSDGRAGLVLPDGALTETTSLSVSPSPALPVQVGVLPGSIYQFGPEGTQFAEPVTMTIKYDRAAIPAGYSEASLRLFTFNADAGSWQQVPGSFVDMRQGTVSGKVVHFSVYAAAADPPPDFFVWANSAGEWVTGEPTDRLLHTPKRFFQSELGQTYGGETTKFFTAVPFRVAADWMQDGSNNMYCSEFYPTYSVDDPSVMRIDSVTTGYHYYDECTDHWEHTRIAWTTTLAVGSTYIRVSLDGYRDSAKVVVAPPYAWISRLVAPWQLQGAHVYLSPGQTIRDTVRVETKWHAPLPNEIVSWSVDDPVIARIDTRTPRSADITGLASGCTFERATLPNGESTKISVIVGVKPVDLVVASFNGEALHTVAGTGCGPEPVPGTSTADLTFNLRWSPNGARFAWPATQIRVAEWNGSNLRTLPTLGVAKHLAWSPDGNQIVYSTFSGVGANSGALRIINVDGTGDRALTSASELHAAGEMDVFPDWSPDRSRILFLRGVSTRNPAVDPQTSQTAVYSIRPDGSDLQLVEAPESSQNLSSARWSPNGSRIAFLRFTSASDFELIIRNLDGTIRQVFEGFTGDQDVGGLLHWSPNGAMIQAGRSIVQADGSGRRTVEAHPKSFSWTSDSRQLAFENGYSTFLVNADGSGLRKITGDSDSGFQGAAAIFWRPTSPSVP